MTDCIYDCIYNGMTPPLMQYNLRMDPDLKAWLKAYAEENGMSESQVIRDLLEGLRENRVTLRPRGPDPFPGQQRLPAGETPQYPILIAPGMFRTEPPAFGWFASEVQGIGIYNTLVPPPTPGEKKP